MNKITRTLFLLAGLCLVSCAGKESSRSETKEASPVAAAEVSPQLAALLPARDEVPGWAMSKQPRSFKAANLWQFIDGAADRYLAYGFEELATSEYVQDGTGLQVLVDIYRMQDVLNAFGIYTQERNPEYQFLKIGNEGYVTGTTLNFWIGSYYVKITAFEEKDTTRRGMASLAGAVAAKVTAPGAEPAEVAYFPKAGQLPHTVVYIPRDVLGQSFLTSGFEARYKEGDREYRMILVILESPETAQGALARYRQFLSGGGRPVKDLAAPGEGGFLGADSVYGNTVAVRLGRHIAMALGALSEGEAEKLVAGLVGNIRRSERFGPP